MLESKISPDFLPLGDEAGQRRQLGASLLVDFGQVGRFELFPQILVEQELNRGQSPVSLDDDQILAALLQKQGLMNEVAVVRYRHGDFFDRHLLPEDFEQVELRSVRANDKFSEPRVLDVE